MTVSQPETSRDTAEVLEVVASVVRLLREAAAGPASEGEGVSLTEFRLLKRLSTKVWLARELAADLDVTSATISTAVDGLVRRGLVERRASAGDRRAVPLAATPQGQAVIEAAQRRQYRALAGLLERLRPTERRALRVAVRALADVLDIPRSR